jgi:hypothetical protein
MGTVEGEVEAAADLEDAKTLFAPLTMLLEPIGSGVRDFCSKVLRPIYASKLPKTLASLQKLLDSDSDTSDAAQSDSDNEDGTNRRRDQLALMPAGARVLPGEGGDSARDQLVPYIGGPSSRPGQIGGLSSRASSVSRDELSQSRMSTFPSNRQLEASRWGEGEMEELRKGAGMQQPKSSHFTRNKKHLDKQVGHYGYTVTLSSHCDNSNHTVAL